MEQAPQPSARGDRLLPWIAAERALRSFVLLAVGIALVTHPHADWAAHVSHAAARLGLNPNSNWIHRIVNDLRRVTANEDLLFGTIAIAYGLLEGTEAYGLWKRRPWGEWLTLVATSLLLIPEIWELTKGTTPLKVGTLLLNLLVVAYLAWRLRERARSSV